MTIADLEEEFEEREAEREEAREMADEQSAFHEALRVVELADEALAAERWTDGPRGVEQ